MPADCRTRAQDSRPLLTPGPPGCNRWREAQPFARNIRARCLARFAHTVAALPAEFRLLSACNFSLFCTSIIIDVGLQIFYNCSRKNFESRRTASSFRRYHIHCPILVASISPASRNTDIWCEMVGCDRLIRSSISQAHMPEDLSNEQQPGSFSMLRIRRRVGSAIARSIAVKTSSLAVVAVGIFASTNIQLYRLVSICFLAEQPGTRTGVLNGNDAGVVTFRAPRASDQR